MAKNIFMWLLIILLLISGSMLGLELYGSSQYKPSQRFGITQDPVITALQQDVADLKEKITELESKTQDPIAQTDNRLSSTSTPTTTNTQNTAFPNNNPSTATGTTQTPVVAQNTAFSNCVTSAGKDETGVAATLTSNVCILNNLYTRPNTFSLTQEVLSYVEANADGGGKLSNVQNEIYNYKSGDAAIFTLDKVKIGDKYRITSKVTNLNGTYTLDSITKAEKVGQ
jgi:hypothetical protein